MEFAEEWGNEASVSQNDDLETEKKDEPPSLSPLSAHLIPGYETFDDYLQDAFDAMRAGIKAANNLPAGDNFNYYTCFPSFNDARRKDMERMLATMQSIIKIAGGSSNIQTRDCDEKFDLLLEANDQLLDQANILMDEESGILRNPQVELVVSQVPKPVVNGTWNIRTNHSNQVSEKDQSSEKVRLLGGKNVQRPQLMFKDKIDNSSKPWIPRIKEKPNSLKPLALYVEEGEHNEVFNHPYEFELNKFQVPKCQLKKKSTSVKYKSLDDTKFIFIDKPADIRILLEDLGNCKEIAIDLEHHSYRTFQGITCLMQISTTTTDYLIDTLTLRSELHQLNEIFTKPSILKVFHGADMDILWLQRDLSLYVVNMFDTHQAAKQLNLPYLSLAYLLNKYCGIDPNKHFQLADWRIRPLPSELMRYAREDTHYLLYIKDMLNNELIEAANGKSNILKAVYDQSTEICKRTYVKPIWTEESCINMYRKSQKSFNNKQMYALLELHKWRDLVAREEDDSIGYVLPNHMLLNIAETLPREMQGILACCNPIPPLVRQNLLKIHKMVLKAREQPLVKSIPDQDIRQRLTQPNHTMVDTGVSFLYIPHDIPSGTEARADLPCLLDKDHKEIVSRPLEANECQMVKHTVTIFDTPVISEDEEMKGNKREEKKEIIFVSPFMRYKCVIPMVVDEEAKQREQRQKKEHDKEKEEEDLTVKIEDKYINETEINESKNRVHQHFIQVSQTNNQVQISSKKKKKKFKQKNNDGNDFSMTTSTSCLDVGTVHMSKKTKQQAQEAIEERKVQESLAQTQGNKCETVKSIRARKKGDKKVNEKLLKRQGMLPSEKFNYKSVDFSSFQGGSTQSNANQTQFQQPQHKKKKMHQKWKKQKLNI
ncbi:exosome component 10 isoform X2 [Monomorium pharaonis]|uniref:exosome component 10 isoform X2 n=1 Tax=Monomorium pharaonis TaxID=307658 RepID=UPI00063FC1DB|nr:exosome component 10 isoform X2 [Monomorium pharaonis]